MEVIMLPLLSRLSEDTFIKDYDSLIKQEAYKYLKQ